jgi:thiazole synthase
VLEDTPLVIGPYTFRSRLFVGTGKYPTIPVMQAAHAASGAEVVTVAIRRIHLDDPAGKTLIDHLDRATYTLLPNTAGCYTAKDAVLTA